jgi:alcohol dehydrogenase class IV
MSTKNLDQTIIIGSDSPSQLGGIFEGLGVKRCMLVCGGSFSKLAIAGRIFRLPVQFVQFSGFSPNPRYEDIVEGVNAFRAEECEAILAVGGGSAIDVAKCIKLFAPMDEHTPYYAQPFEDNTIPLVALPTTAGTGSESTQFSVIYVDGEKISINYPGILPDYAILDPGVLETLPLYQKKCSMLDALFQALEAWWSVNSTEESIQYSRKAVALFLESMDGYLQNTEEGNAGMLHASNWAGRAINITRTTAPHAMSYKMTTLFGIPHGHAVALSFPYVWEYMNDNMDRAVDRRGRDYLNQTFSDMAAALGYPSIPDAIGWTQRLLGQLGMASPKNVTENQLDELVRSVNVERLGNSPVALDEGAIRKIYKQIVG